MYNLTKQMTLLDYFTFLMNHSININENKSGDWPLNTCTYLIANTPHFKVDRQTIQVAGYIPNFTRAQVNMLKIKVMV